MSPFEQPICEQIWNQKYRFQTTREGLDSDENVEDTWHRIAQACAMAHPHEFTTLYEQFMGALTGFKFLPAGRIIAGAGTGRRVTLFNCYVMGTVPDSLDGIFDALKEAALTMQQGGGIGYDFSTLRPKGAPVKGVESFSSGPLTFMDVWDSMCKTIMSAGSRRGAMMATMRCDHPDIEEFITAKKDPLRLRNFNLSVLCTDEFMEAVKNDDPWDLQFEDKIYKTINAADLWNLIMENTYSHAEPGVIFIDRINKMNNLWFLETIAATNPCGEQPLPPYGACLLGSINLPMFVCNPFIAERFLDWDALEKTVRAAVRMLDCVIDISNFPLEAQKEEAYLKRRIGLGITGLADMLFMMGYRYGSEEAFNMTSQVMKLIAEFAYDESVNMAKDWGEAPFLGNDSHALDDFIDSAFIQTAINPAIRERIEREGIRNSHLLSIAPTGTISLFANNVSSGCEPIFAHKYQRKVTNDDGTKRTENVYDYAVLKFEEHFGDDNPKAIAWWENFMVTAQDLPPQAHLDIQAACQKYVDSSISKTINLPEDISFDDFKEVYSYAYEHGCKGCTTYRPNDITGSVLEVKQETKQEEEPIKLSQDARLFTRPEQVQGITYKVRWNQTAYYITFNYIMDEEAGQNVPIELFISSKNPEHQAWMAALTRMISAIFQRGGNIDFIPEEMKSVHDPKGGEWVQGRYCPSLVALIGHTLDKFLRDISGQQDEEVAITPPPVEASGTTQPISCPQCHGYNVVLQNGCPTCRDCGHSKCG